MGKDLKYGNVTVENVRSTPIGEDEPVVVFRAQDRLLPAVLEMYAQLAEAEGSPAEHTDLVYKAHAQVLEWQARNHAKTPGTTEE